MVRRATTPVPARWQVHDYTRVESTMVAPRENSRCNCAGLPEAVPDVAQTGLDITASPYAVAPPPCAEPAAAGRGSRRTRSARARRPGSPCRWTAGAARSGAPHRTAAPAGDQPCGCSGRSRPGSRTRRRSTGPRRRWRVHAHPRLREARPARQRGQGRRGGGAVCAGPHPEVSRGVRSPGSPVVPRPDREKGGPSAPPVGQRPAQHRQLLRRPCRLPAAGGSG